MEIFFQDALIVLVIIQLHITCCWASLSWLGLGRMDKYLHVGIQNVVCTIVVVELKQSVVALLIVDNNTFLSSNWKHCVIYFINFFLLLLSVHVRICKPFGFLVMECNTFFCSSFNYTIEMCVPNMCCEGLETSCISFDCLLWKIELIVHLGCVYSRLRYGWSFFKNSNNFFFFQCPKGFYVHISLGM